MVRATLQEAEKTAGDFKAWSTEWESKVSNNRRLILLERFSSVDIVVASIIVDISSVGSALIR